MTHGYWRRAKSFFARALGRSASGGMAVIQETDETASVTAEPRKLPSPGGRADFSDANVGTADLEILHFPAGLIVAGQFRITGVLGQGGMGIVYRAEDLTLSRPVALKFLGAGPGASSAMDRILREARAAAALNHPSICVIHGTGAHEGRPFIVMELLEGESLKQRISRARILSDQLLDWGVQILDALEAAHRAGVVHRDIKPANIFVTARGPVKILDFGLAKLPAPVAGHPTSGAISDLDVTRPGAAMGTAPYMSPEQARGESLDARTDLFSFGAVLYEMATGKRAFQNDTVTGTLAAILYRTPPQPSTIQTGIPPGLDLVISKALQKSRESRYQHAAEIRDDLLHLRRSAESRAPSSTSSLTRPAIAAIVLALLLIAAIGAWFIVKQFPPHGNLVERQLTRNLPENRNLGYDISPDGRQLLYADLSGLHLKAIETGETRDIAVPDELKSHLWDVAFLPDAKRALLLVEAPSKSYQLWAIAKSGGGAQKLAASIAVYAISSKGIAFTRRPLTNEIWTMGLDGRNAHRILSGQSDSLSALAWSPTGERIAYIKARNAPGTQWGGVIETIDANGNDPRLVWSDSRLLAAAGSSNPLAWAADGRLLFTLKESVANSEESGNLWAMLTDTRTGRISGRPQRITNWSRIIPSQPRVSRDGRRLAIAKHHRWQNIYVGGLNEDGTRLDDPKRFTVSDSFDSVCSWMPKSNVLVFASDVAGGFQLYKEQSGHDNIGTALTPAAADLSYCGLTPDARWILYSATDGASASKRTLLFRVPVSGGRPEQIMEIPAEVEYSWNCSVKPEGTCVFGRVEQGRFVFYSLDPLHGLGRELTGTPWPRTARLDWGVSPDGTRVAVRLGGNIRILDLRNRTESHIEVPPGWSLYSITFSADGKAVIAGARTTAAYHLVRLDLNGTLHDLLNAGRVVFPEYPAPSPDGRFLAFGQLSFEDNIWLLERF